MFHGTHIHIRARRQHRDTDLSLLVGVFFYLAKYVTLMLQSDCNHTKPKDQTQAERFFRSAVWVDILFFLVLSFLHQLFLTSNQTFMSIRLLHAQGKLLKFESPFDCDCRFERRFLHTIKTTGCIEWRSIGAIDAVPLNVKWRFPFVVGLVFLFTHKYRMAAGIETDSCVTIKKSIISWNLWNERRKKNTVISTTHMPNYSK